MRSIANVVIVSAVVLLCGSLSAIAATHPAEGLAPNEFSDYASTGLGPEYNWGGFEFFDPAAKQPYNTLTDLEKYMVVGAGDGAGNNLGPWYSSVYVMAARYAQHFGQLPEVLSGDIVRSLPGLENLTDADLAELRNPLTGQWPRLNAEQFAPGDIYLRQLTEAEMRHFASEIPIFQHEWFEGKTFETERIMSGDSPGDALTQDCELYLTPCYVRVYGNSGIIHTGFASALKLR